MKLTFAIARSGVPDAEDIFVEAAATVKDADSEEELRNFFQNCEAASPRHNGVTVGTLFYDASQYGAEFRSVETPSSMRARLPPDKRKPLKGGTYSPDEALELLNSHYLIGKTDQEVGIFRIKDDGPLAFTPPNNSSSTLPISSSDCPVDQPSQPVEKFWKESPQRHQRKIVFKPGGTTEPDEFNLWRGFGVEPRKGWQKQRRLLRHIRQIICRRDKAKFKYLIRWLAWAVQNPDKHPGTVIVLKSRKQGTGKSTLGVVMLKFSGHTVRSLMTRTGCLDGSTIGLNPSVSSSAEEILWAGDHKTTDKLKSMITANTIRIERKHGGAVVRYQTGCTHDDNKP